MVSAVDWNAFSLVVLDVVDVMPSKHSVSLVLMALFDSFDCSECINRLEFYRYVSLDVHNISNQFYISHSL